MSNGDDGTFDPNDNFDPNGPGFDDSFTGGGGGGGVSGNGDNIRKTHDVRIWEDGSMTSIKNNKQASDTDPASVGLDPGDTDPNVNPDEGDGSDSNDRSHIDLRRSDTITLKRGSGYHFMKTTYNIAWNDDGDFPANQGHPDSRETEEKQIVPEPTGDSSDDDGEDGEDPSPVPVLMVKSMIVKTAARVTVRPTLRNPNTLTVNDTSQYIGKRIFFENGSHDGRAVKELKVKDGNFQVRFEKILSNRYGVGGNTYQISRFEYLWPDENDTSSNNNGTAGTPAANDGLDQAYNTAAGGDLGFDGGGGNGGGDGGG